MSSVFRDPGLWMAWILVDLVLMWAAALSGSMEGTIVCGSFLLLSSIGYAVTAARR